MKGAGILEIVSCGELETLCLGRRIGQALPGGALLALVGPLGAGKTRLVKGIAAGNGLADPDRVTSPTFVLVNEYPGRLTIHHLDVYRLNSAAEVASLGVEEMLRPDSAVIVEWADRFPHAWPDDACWIHIQPGPGADERRFRIEPRGPASAAWVARIG